MTGRRHYAPGAFCWVGLATSDPAGATTFYSGLFGWQAEDLPAGEGGTYTLLRLAGRDVAILFRQTPQARAAGVAPHWTCFISVGDAASTARRAGELGGAAVFREAFDVADAGRVAAIRDPCGAMVSLWQPRSRIGATVVDDIGAVAWIELATTDVGRAASFYGELLGREYETGDGGYVTIKIAGARNGGMRRQAGPPNWLPYFAIESADAGAQAAERLGGRALPGAPEIPIGRSGLIADPQSAVFAVLEGDRDCERPR
jgi:predicted enzyme related to lactoylglutathione lyase